MFTVYYQKEAKNCFQNSNDYPLYSDKKAVQNIINEQPFAWLELFDDFSLNSNKCSHTNDSEVDLNNASVLSSKTADFLTLA